MENHSKMVILDGNDEPISTCFASITYEAIKKYVYIYIYVLFSIGV